MSFAQLEEAAKAQMQDDAGGEEGGKDKTKKAIASNRPPPRDDEMHVYLSEIRQKQEGLIAKLRQD